MRYRLEFLNHSVGWACRSQATRRIGSNALGRLLGPPGGAELRGGSSHFENLLVSRYYIMNK